MRKYDLDLRLELSLTHGYNKTVWPYFGDPTEANAGYNLIVNIIGKHSVIGQNIIIYLEEICIWWVFSACIPSHMHSGTAKLKTNTGL